MPLYNGKNAEFLVFVLLLILASTKYYETYTQCLLQLNTDQVEFWWCRLLQFFTNRKIKFSFSFFSLPELNVLKLIHNTYYHKTQIKYKFG